MVIQFRRIGDSGAHAVIPKSASLGSAGADLTATSEHIPDSADGDYVEYGTGLAIRVPPGYVGLLFPRSSISNTCQLLSNSVGVLDSDYRGEIKFRFRQAGAGRRYRVGERIGQIVIVPIPSVTYVEVDTLDDTIRGTGGYGSSGR